MTFIVNQQAGFIKRTSVEDRENRQAITTYDPDDTWTPAQ